MFLHFIFFFSGIAGLGYEIVWVRMLAVGFGHEVAGLLSVLAAFFGGLALGAALLDRRIARSLCPGRWYAALEILIGVWGLATIALIPWTNEVAAWLIGTDPGPLRQWLVAFALPLALLLPATAAMGATLPAMDRFVCRLRADGRSVGGLYGVNTLGAMTGTLGATFFAIPAWGCRSSLVVLGAVNLLCALAVLFGPARGESKRAPVIADLVDLPGARRLRLSLWATGLLGIGYEVLAVRVLSQVLENTVYSFAAALSAYLFATAVGALAYQRWGRAADYRRLLGHLLQATATACLLGTLALTRAEALYGSVHRALGGSFAGAIAAELATGLAVFFLPAFVMGALFSHLAQGARHPQGGVGSALALNTLGGALAPALFGVILLPVLGAKVSLVAVALAYLLLTPRLPLVRWAPVILPLLLVLALPARLRLAEPPPGSEVLAYLEGVTASVATLRDGRGALDLRVNGHFNMGGTSGSFGERRQAHIPLLLHPAPRRALFLGIGTGITLGAAARHPGLEAEGVELIPEVVEMLPFFRQHNGNLLRQPRLEVRVADARRYVRATAETYDVIVADLFHPARDGAGALYTVEHFQAVRRRLTRDGLFCQWLPLHQLDLPTLGTIVRSFLAVFPDSHAFLAYLNVEAPALGLVGNSTLTAWTPDWYERRVHTPGLSMAMAENGLGSSLALFGTFVGDGAWLRELSVTTALDTGALNTDDHPRVIFLAPRAAYARTRASSELLHQLMQRWNPQAAQLLASDGARQGLKLAARLDDYFVARDLYLQAEIERVGGDLDEAVESYLASVRASTDFRTGYAQLLLLAQEQAAVTPAVAIEILKELELAAPERPEASQLRRHLTGTPANQLPELPPSE